MFYNFIFAFIKDIIKINPAACYYYRKTVQDKYEQIGDAVPPLLSYAWGITIKKIMESYG